MMNMSRRQNQLERQERRAQQNEREDSAGKLLVKVPELTALSLAIHEGRPDGCLGENQYIRRVVVDHAPALDVVVVHVPSVREVCTDAGVLDEFPQSHACLGVLAFPHANNGRRRYGRSSLSDEVSYDLKNSISLRQRVASSSRCRELDVQSV